VSKKDEFDLDLERRSSRKLPDGSTVLAKLPEKTTLEEVQAAIEEVRKLKEFEIAKRELRSETRKVLAIQRSILKDSEYRPEYADQLIEHLGSGRKFSSFAGVLGVSIACLFGWSDKFPQFAEAREIGEALQLSSWEERLIAIADGKNSGDFKAVKFALLNYFKDDYQDHTDKSIHGNTQIIIETGVVRSVESREVEVIGQDGGRKSITVSPSFQKFLAENNTGNDKKEAAGIDKQQPRENLLDIV